MLGLKDVDMFLSESFYFLYKFFYCVGGRKTMVRILRRVEDLQLACSLEGETD